MHTTGSDGKIYEIQALVHQDMSGNYTTIAKRHHQVDVVATAAHPVTASDPIQAAAPHSIDDDDDDGHNTTELVTVAVIITAVVTALITALLCLALYLQFGQTRIVAVNFDATETAQVDSEDIKPAEVVGDAGDAPVESEATEEDLSPADTEPAQQSETRDRTSSVAVIDI